MNYIIVEAYSVDDLVESVNRKIAAGYKPLGGLVIDSAFAGGVRYKQTMIKD